MRLLLKAAVVNTNLPGFNAEAALYRSGIQYAGGVGVTAHTLIDMITPQAEKQCHINCPVLDLFGWRACCTIVCSECRVDPQEGLQCTVTVTPIGNACGKPEEPPVFL